MEDKKEIIQADYFVIKSYTDVKTFHDDLPSTSLFYGAGTFAEKEKNCRHTLLTLNSNVYLFKEVGEGNNFIFDSIQEVEKSFLTSQVFRRARQYGQIKYGDFETDLEVEIKLYEYYNEKRLIINPAGKIDLIYSIHFHKEEDETETRFEYKQFPSLENVIKTDKLNKKLNARLNSITGQR